MFCGWEETFKSKFANVRVIEDVRSVNFTIYIVVVGNQAVSESRVRELAFKYALDDLRNGLLKITPLVTEQLRLEGV